MLKILGIIFLLLVGYWTLGFIYADEDVTPIWIWDRVQTWVESDDVQDAKERARTEARNRIENDGSEDMKE